MTTERGGGNGVKEEKREGKKKENRGREVKGKKEGERVSKRERGREGKGK